ncbi:MAG: hypothetical protein WCD76_13465, partial [Pyrinomonadaceae bacterium]
MLSCTCRINFRAALRPTLKLCLFVCLLAASTSPVPAVAQAAQSADDAATAATREGRLKVFDEVWENINSLYYDPAMRGLDWQAVRAEFRPLAAEAKGEAELYAVMRRMLGRLRDPHTRVFAPGESQDWRVTRFVAVGVSVRELGGEMLVTSVEH